jgi:hypothetical protein
VVIGAHLDTADGTLGSVDVFEFSDGELTGGCQMVSPAQDDEDPFYYFGRAVAADGDLIAAGGRGISCVFGDSVSGGVDGDINNDGGVDVLDLVALVSAWGLCSGCPEDLDGDGHVGVGDLIILLSSWE